MFKKVLIYVSVIGIFVAGIGGILQIGSHPESVHPPRAAQSDGATESVAGRRHSAPGGEASIGQRIHESVQDPLTLLLLQVIVIVVLARLMGALFQHFGQPPVIGEMVAGLMLGPSLLGMLSSGTQTLLFPDSSLAALRLLSQIGVILFMFVVGMELDVAHLRQKAHAAVWVSHASIVVPFFLGTSLSLFLYRSLAPAGVPFSAFGLFMGIAMSITAFPVLARIIEERGLSRSALGATAIACAAVDDVTAWCVLALAVAIVKAHALSGAVVSIGLSLMFIALMILGVKPWAARLIGQDIGGPVRAKAVVAGVLSFVFLCSLTTELIGIHALFGAFLAGVAMPQHGNVRGYLKKRLDIFTSAFLLPLFFAFTGLRTTIGLLNDLQSWLICLSVIAVAVAGKVGGSALAARITGMSWHDSFVLGALMNTRGLVELIVLNLGYDLGILSPRIFTMMVLMALTTTFMTGPLLTLLESVKRKTAVDASAVGALA